MARNTVGVDNDTGGVNPTAYALASATIPDPLKGLWQTIGMGAVGSTGDYSDDAVAAAATNFMSAYNGVIQTPVGKAMLDVYGNPFLEVMLRAGVLGSNEDMVFQELAEKGMSPYDARVKAALGGGGGGGRGAGGGVSKAQQYAAAEAAIRNQAQTLGHVTFDEPKIKALAKTAVDGNWSNDQLTDFLVGDATKNWDKLKGGTLLGQVDQIKSAAAKQLIKISDATARQWSARLSSGEIDEVGLGNMIQQQAIARYGWAAETIKQGVTMSDFLAPARDRIAETLELAPEGVDLMDARYSRMITVVDKDGKTRAATDAEVMAAARRDERWANTNNARELTTAAALRLRDYFEGN